MLVRRLHLPAAWRRGFSAGPGAAASAAAPITATVGIDFGTESVRAIVVSVADGAELGTSTHRYRHGQITPSNPDALEKLQLTLPTPSFALQHPGDWLEGASNVVASAVAEASATSSSGVKVVGVGVDFTSCTMVPCTADGIPLSLSADRKHGDFATRPHAWPKLWKHHAAWRQAEELTAVAEARDEAWLRRYGGVIGLEWLFPKALELYDEDREIYDAADLWVEAGDWFVWQLVGGKAPTRSTCQAGYKALWSHADGYPDPDYLDAVRPGFSSVLPKVVGETRGPGDGSCGGLRPRSELEAHGLAGFGGLPRGTPVSAAVIDAHAGVPGAGVGSAGSMVLVLGTSACYMVNSTEEKMVEGVAGVVQDGILPGLVGYETGQSAVGDLFGWLEWFAGRSLPDLAAEAEATTAPGCDGVLIIDHFNGCRTPLMDGSLRGSIHGMSLATSPAMLYRAIAEGTAFGCRRIVELYKNNGVPVDRYVATGGLAHNAFFRQVLADVLQVPIEIHPADNGPAVGAAIYGASAAGVFPGGMEEAVRVMARNPPAEETVHPNADLKGLYDERFADYLSRAQPTPDESRRLQAVPSNGKRGGSAGGNGRGNAPQRRSFHTHAAARLSSQQPSSSSADETQTAAFIFGAKDVRIGTLPTPTAADGVTELLDVEMVGICGSDLHYYKDGGIGSDTISAPFVPGHEVAARASADIPSKGIAAGDLVAFDPASPCGICEWCLDGHSNLCPNMMFAGAPPYHGALTKQIAVPLKSIFKLPQTWPAERAAMLEPLGIAVHAFNLAKPVAGESVAVVGCGPIGLLLTQLLKSAGVTEIVAVDPLEYRQTAAATYGASAVGPSVGSTVLEATAGRGCDLVIEATNSEDGIADAAKACRIGGRIILVGIPDGNLYAPLPADLIRRKAISLKTSRRMGNVFDAAIEAVSSGNVDVDSLVTHSFPLAETAAAFEHQVKYTDGALKTTIVIN